MLTDTSIMWFGKYKGKRLIDVPAYYLIWLYENKKAPITLNEYIKDNLDALKLENEKK